MNLQFLFRANDLVDNASVKVMLLALFTELTHHRCKSLATQYLTPPLRYAAMLGSDKVEVQKVYDQCMREWASLLKAESAMAAGAKVPGLRNMHWRLSALTRLASKQILYHFCFQGFLCLQHFCHQTNLL